MQLHCLSVLIGLGVLEGEVSLRAAYDSAVVQQTGMAHGASVKGDFNRALLPYQITGIGQDAFLRNRDFDFAVPLQVTIWGVG